MYSSKKIRLSNFVMTFARLIFEDARKIEKKSVKYILWNDDEDDAIQTKFMKKLEKFGWTRNGMAKITFSPLSPHELEPYWKIERTRYFGEPTSPRTFPYSYRYEIYFTSVPILIFEKHTYSWESHYQFGRWDDEFLMTLQHYKKYLDILLHELPSPLPQLPMEIIYEIRKFLVNF
jgi:hypothetical protein